MESSAGATSAALWPSTCDTPAMQRMAASIEVRPSALHGLGAFARERLPPNTVLGWYRGERLTGSEAAARYPHNDAQYLLEVSHDVFVDAADATKSNWTRYVNSHVGAGVTANCAFTCRGSIKTTKAVQAGQELLISYGPWYRFGQARS